MTPPSSACNSVSAWELHTFATVSLKCASGSTVFTLWILRYSDFKMFKPGWKVLVVLVCLALRQMKNDCGIFMFSIAFPHCCAGKDILIVQSIICALRLSVMPNRNACLWVIRWQCFLSLDTSRASTLSSFALRTETGIGMPRKDGMAYALSLLQKAKILT